MGTDLYIIAAGKGSRMGGNIPKALVPITDIPNMTTTLQQIGRKFKNVFIVANVLVADEWLKWSRATTKQYPSLMDNVSTLFISSGLGDGHAVLHGLNEAANSGLVQSEDIVVAWGDVFFPHAEIIDELLTWPARGQSGIIPVVREDNPYVSILVDDYMDCMSADFSKYGESHPTGFHDQSVFRFRRTSLQNALSVMHASFWKNGRYITPGGELSLLHCFHYFYNVEDALVVYETDWPTRSFNTPEEVAAIQTEITTKWHHQFAPYSSR
jgi:molybdopterin-guanine dinucleotide biosynthesis protein A